MKGWDELERLLSPEDLTWLAWLRNVLHVQTQVPAPANDEFVRTHEDQASDRNH